MLANRFPHLLWWGPEYIQIYNGAYIPGARHPAPGSGDLAGGMILALDGLAIETVYSVERALGRVQTFAPEVVLLDIGLPGLDG